MTRNLLFFVTWLLCQLLLIVYLTGQNTEHNKRVHYTNTDWVSIEHALVSQPIKVERRVRPGIILTDDKSKLENGPAFTIGLNSQTFTSPRIIWEPG